MSLLELFVSVDDFCQIFLPVWEKKLFAEGSKKRCRTGQLSMSEIMTIIIYFHQSRYRNFKTYYTEHVCQHLRGEFPNLVSYERFVILTPSAFVPLSAYLKSLYGSCSGISFVDSTALEVCDNHRIHNHRVFEGIAQRGKGSMGWFYGLKVHLVINDRGEILACQITLGNVDDRKPLPTLFKRLFGKLIADRGYISQALRTFLKLSTLVIATRSMLLSTLSLAWSLIVISPKNLPWVSFRTACLCSPLKHYSRYTR